MSKKEMKFKRSINSSVLSSLIGIFILIISILLVLSEAHIIASVWSTARTIDTRFSFLLIVVLHAGFGLFVLWLCLYAIHKILAPDFTYTICVKPDYIVIKKSKHCHIRLDRPFRISKYSKHYLLLDDGTTRILLAFTKDSLGFLEEICK